jgi:hypothetical protein
MGMSTSASLGAGAFILAPSAAFDVVPAPAGAAVVNLVQSGVHPAPSHKRACAHGEEFQAVSTINVPCPAGRIGIGWGSDRRQQRACDERREECPWSRRQSEKRLADICEWRTLSRRCGAGTEGRARARSGLPRNPARSGTTSARSRSASILRTSCLPRSALSSPTGTCGATVTPSHCLPLPSASSASTSCSSP